MLGAMKIFLADPYPAVCAALRRALALPGISITGEAHDTISLLSQISRLCPDVILLEPDVFWPACSGRSLTGSLKEMLHLLQYFCPGAQVLVMSARPEVEPDVLAAGSQGFFCKKDPPEGLLDKLQHLPASPAP